MFSQLVTLNVVLNIYPNNASKSCNDGKCFSSNGVNHDNANLENSVPINLTWESFLGISMIKYASKRHLCFWKVSIKYTSIY